MHDQRNVQYENRKMLLWFIRATNEATIVKNLTKSTDANYRYVHGMLFIFESNSPVIVTKCYSNICGNIQQSLAWEQKKNRHLKAVIKIPPESLSKRFSISDICIREKCRVVVNNLCLVVDPYRDKIVSYLIVQEITWRQYTCVVWYLVFGWSARCAKGFFWTT